MQPDHRSDLKPARKDNTARAYRGVRKKRFLAELARTSHIARSAERAGISLSTLYFWRTNDAGFRANWLRALAAGYELLEMEMLQRARHGRKRKIYYRGAVVDTVNEHDDALGLKLLAFHRQSAMLARELEEEQATAAGDLTARLDKQLTDTLYALGRDDREPVMTRSENPGRSLRPWSPAHPRGIWQANGDLLITWVRRSRDGLQWSDFVDVPLAESFERYHVSIEPDGLPGNRQLIETGASEHLIPRNQLDDIRSSGSDRIVVKLQQLGRGGLSDAEQFSIPI